MPAQAEKAHNVLAQFAWEKVNDIKDKKLREEYKDIVRKFPALLQSGGLGSALAFLLSKGTKRDQESKKLELDMKKEHALLYQHLQEWLCNEKKIFPNCEGLKEKIKGEDREAFLLMECVVSHNSWHYRWATDEARALIVWLKRFAEALAPDT